MQLLKNVLIGLVVLVVALCAATPLLPGQVHVERTVTVAAPPAAVFGVVNDLRRFNDWSPWFKRDPNATYSFDGPGQGVGAKLAWSGNSDVGSGTQEIIKSAPDTRVEVRLVFEGFGSATSYYQLEPDGAGTRLTWGYDASHGSFAVMNRWFGLFMDGMLGADYEEGLANLKALVESLPAKPAAPAEPAAAPAAG